MVQEDKSGVLLVLYIHNKRFTSFCFKTVLFSKESNVKEQERKRERERERMCVYCILGAHVQQKQRNH
jgi:hypothetical protein